MSQVSIVDIEHNNPQIPTRFNANVGFAIPIANTLEIYGDTVLAGTVPVYTTGSGNNITTNVQISQAIAASDATRVGLAAFDSASFGVDANGFVTFTGSVGLESFNVDAATAPGTDPVLPNGSGIVTVTGGQVAAGTTTNVIRTHSTAANSYTIEIQRSSAQAASTIGANGVSHFNSASFGVDANGFVTVLSAALGVLSVSGTLNRITSTGGQNPVIDIAATYVGQTSITTLGTVTTGTWHGTTIGTTFGGTGLTSYTTGDTLYASAANVLSKLPIGSTNQVLTVVGGIPAWAPAAATGIVTINGDSGSVTGTTVTLFANAAAKNCGSTVKFVNSGTTSTLNVTDGLSNIFIGLGAGNALVSGANNSGQGRLVLASVTSGDSNCALGSTSLTNLTTGANNCAVGVIALQNLVSGSNCIGIGRAAGQNYTTSESNNICIGSGVAGTVGESNVTRIGNGTTVCIVAGISGVTTSNTNMVTINTATGQLGSAAVPSGTVTSVSGTTNRITSTGGTTPVIDISAAYVGQTSINTLGTVTTGTWNGTTVGPTFGGTGQSTYTTGDILYASASNTLSKLAAGAANAILTMSGGVPSWSAAAGGGFMETQVVITSAQVKALRATPITIVAAPGAGKFINVVTMAWKLTYGGTSAFTAATGQTIPLAYTNTAGSPLATSGFSNTSIVATSNQIGYAVMTNSVGIAATSRENQPIVAYNSSATEITGNAANDNTITVSVTYQVLTL